MKRILATLLLVGLAVVLLAGCQESESDMIQRARIVANQNMKLENQLEQKDQQIAELQEQVEQLKAENDRITQESGDTNFKVMQIVLESEKRNEALQKENEALKEELENLKTQ